MLNRLLIVFCLLVAALAAPAGATAKPLVGISDNRPAMIGDPLFKALGVKRVRLVLAYNSVSAGERGDDEIASRVGPYIRAADAAGLDVLITFEHARGNAADVCNKQRNRAKSQCRLPSVASYHKEVKKFLTLFPTIHTISPWNEANHYTQGTYRSPKRAAQFAKTVEKVCRELKRRCTVPTMDILDLAENPSSRHPTYKRTARYVKRLRRAYGKQPAICGLHNYGDVNRFRTNGTRALVKAMRCKQYWITETGGFFSFVDFWNKKMKKAGKCRTPAKCQAKAVRFLFNRVVKVSKRIRRVYIYDWFGGSEPRFDAGIVQGKGIEPKSKQRPAYGVVKDYLG